MTDTRRPINGHPVGPPEFPAPKRKRIDWEQVLCYLAGIALVVFILWLLVQMVPPGM